jgi:hypothetical protein
MIDILDLECGFFMISSYITDLLFSMLNNIWRLAMAVLPAKYVTLPWQCVDYAR